MANIKINDLSKEIAKALQIYTNEVTEGMEQAKEEVANDAIQELKANSPRSPKRAKKYANGWRKKKVGKALVIYNRKYQLTHLLEKGHAKVNGGRVRAIPHIGPVEEKAIKAYVSKTEKVIRG